MDKHVEAMKSDLLVLKIVIYSAEQALELIPKESEEGLILCESVADLTRAVISGSRAYDEIKNRLVSYLSDKFETKFELNQKVKEIEEDVDRLLKQRINNK